MVVTSQALTCKKHFHGQSNIKFSKMYFVYERNIGMILIKDHIVNKKRNWSTGQMIPCDIHVIL